MLCTATFPNIDLSQRSSSSGLQSLYIVRHCKAEGQEAEAALTTIGHEQAQRLSLWLRPYTIDYIVSSPYARAVQTIKPYAEIMNKPIMTDDRLIERILSKENRSDWLECLKQTFHNPDLCFDGGESSRQATGRMLSVVTELLNGAHRTSLIVGHGNTISLLLNHFDDRFGFEQWRQLSNPDVYRLHFEGGQYRNMQRLWTEHQHY